MLFFFNLYLRFVFVLCIKPRNALDVVGYGMARASQVLLDKLPLGFLIYRFIFSLAQALHDL